MCIRIRRTNNTSNTQKVQKQSKKQKLQRIYKNTEEKTEDGRIPEIHKKKNA